MAEGLSGNIIDLVIFLLPGFVCAWIFYGLTSHPKPHQFERLVQALIYTFLVRGLVIATEWLFIALGDNWFSIGEWDDSSETVVSLLFALLLGGLFAYLVNADVLHRYLRRFKLTSRTSHPSEWFYIFSEKVTFVILHMKDGRRLYGWPKEWPLEPGNGQFYIMLPAWILSDGKQQDLPELDGVLVRAEDVKWVEFLNFEEAENVE
ncbi:MAG: DUF6338 family protein [Pseudomonadota bacterium]|uniref:DUF6338 family protein n=1 Tax=Alcanivorax sp. NBRC 102024 TaxID=1113895 RepID=UPI000789C280|nr:DUF6338 family protein [Alcanivorax sp. NBRC 102024]MEE2601643.1 DUF6338 family protein [Pseudomonadota bacterium]